MKTYRDHFQPLLEEELHAEQLIVLERRNSSSSGNHRKSAQYTLRSLVATKKKRLFSLSVYSLALKATSAGLSQTVEFSKGDLVRLCSNRSDADAFVESTVLAKRPGSLLVTVPIGSDGAAQMDSFVDQREPLKAECGTSTVAYERALDALTSFTTEGPGTTDMAKLLVTSLTETSGFGIKAVDSDGGFPNLPLYVEDEPRDLNRNSENGESDLQKKWQSYCKETVSRLSPQELSEVMPKLSHSLNSSQIGAIKTAVRRRLSLIQGPPGTGKTITAAHMISCVVRLRLGPVLACAASNVAADNLMQKIISISAAGLRIVRIGRVPAIGEELWDKTLESYLEKDLKVRKARNECAAGRMKVSGLFDVEKAAVRQVLKKAHVVVGTCVACGRDDLEGLDFRYVVVDEATQASEPDVLIPLSIAVKSGKQVQLVLVGDQNQLPPTILSRNSHQADGTGLETSLFVRLWQQGIETQLLNVQYRMHPQISAFPSKHFYFNRLRDGISPEDRVIPDFHSFAKSYTVLTQSRAIFVHVSDGKEEKDLQTPDINNTTSAGHSYYNRTEARIVMQVVRELVGADEGGSITSSRAFSLSDIGLISPYAGQVRILKELVARQWGASSIEVSTVDGFQGREKRVILLSSVRSNDKGSVGFLRDWRRLNVAITRAKALLVVVGNERTLSTNTHWRSWIKWVKRHGATTCVRISESGKKADAGQSAEA